MKRYPSQLADQFVVRLPAGWRDAIRGEAKRARRSMNSEIVAAIEAAMAAKGIQIADPKNEEDRQGGNPDGLEQSQLSERI